jgi:hypothetical protein
MGILLDPYVDGLAVEFECRNEAFWGEVALLGFLQICKDAL